MATIQQRNKAFDAVKPLIMAEVPAMFQSLVTDDLILKIVDTVLNSVEKK